MPTHFRLHGDTSKHLLKALGLEGRSVYRIELTFDVSKASTLTVYEYTDLEASERLASWLELADWKERLPARPFTETPEQKVILDKIIPDYLHNKSMETESS